MLMKISVVFFAVCILHFTAGRVVREAPSPPTFTELTKQVDDALGTLHTKFLEFVGVKNDNELVTLVQTQGKTYADKIQDLTKQLAEETKSSAGKADEVFKTLQTKLTGTVDELRSKNPDLFADSDKFQRKFQDNLRTVLKDTEEFNSKLKEGGKEISSNMEQLLKQIYDSTVETAQKVASDVETAIKEKKT